MARPSKSSRSTNPYWDDTSTFPSFAPLAADATTDVVVVGAGITGLTSACLLARAGRSVIVLERDTCAGIDTGHTTAHLTMVTDSRLTELVSRFGRDHARAVWDSGRAAIVQIESLVRELEIDARFDWVDGYLHAPKGPMSDDTRREFQEEAQLARDLGFEVDLFDDVPWVGGPGVRFGGQARFHPRRYLAGVADAVVRAGGRIHEQSAADEFRSDPLSVVSRGHTIRCQEIVIATHNPLVGIAGMMSATVLQTKLALMSSYVVAGRVSKGAVPDALFWDTRTAYEYVRLDPGDSEDTVILGGEDHKTGQADDIVQRYARLESAFSSRVPGGSVTHRWSGQVIETPDGLPYIGTLAEHQYVATGFAGNGMTFGTLAAMMITDAILGRRNPWAELYAPDRSALRRAPWDYLKENIDYPYYLLRDRLFGPEAKSLRSVRRGEGRIVELEGRKVAAYRAPDGKLTLRSAICTHMGCVVAWNKVEQTWDCPCHGSRFRPGGEVLSGPAETPLGEVEA